MSSEPDAVLKRATSGSRAIGSRPLLWCSLLYAFRTFIPGWPDQKKICTLPGSQLLLPHIDAKFADTKAATTLSYPWPPVDLFGNISVNVFVQPKNSNEKLTTFKVQYFFTK